MGTKNDDDCACGRGVTRRGFIASLGASAVVGAAVGAATAEPASAAASAKEMTPCVLTINGRRHTLQVEPRWSLLHVLREHLGLTGTKVGCERGECGACTVLIDDTPRYACLTLALEAQGHEVTTLEGLMRGEELGPTQQAFVDEDAFQCGYCTPGQIMSAEGLLRTTSAPKPDEVRRAMSGNLCRCGAYDHIFKAVQRAAQARRAGGGS